MKKPTQTELSLGKKNKKKGMEVGKGVKNQITEAEDHHKEEKIKQYPIAIKISAQPSWSHDIAQHTLGPLLL